jgi:hypothetical protein
MGKRVNESTNYNSYSCNNEEEIRCGCLKKIFLRRENIRSIRSIASH